MGVWQALEMSWKTYTRSNRQTQHCRAAVEVHAKCSFFAGYFVATLQSPESSLQGTAGLSALVSGKFWKRCVKVPNESQKTLILILERVDLWTHTSYIKQEITASPRPKMTKWGYLIDPPVKSSLSCGSSDDRLDEETIFSWWAVSTIDSRNAHW